MKKTSSLFFALIMLIIGFCISSNNCFADSLAALNPVATSKIIAKPSITPTAPNLDVQSYILVDANSGNIIAEKNADAKRPPASLTKMMTLYVVSNALNNGQIKLDDMVLVSKKAWKTGGSKMFIKVGDSVPVKDLLQGIIVDSGNDSCVAMAEHVAGDESSFADAMNQQAKALGMQNSNFTDSTGLPHPNHYTTARDLAVLARALIMHFPQYYPLYKEKWFTYNGIRQPNRNRLLWRDPSVDGIKTGHTEDAGFCLVASAKKDDTRLIAVVMGAPSDNVRADASQSLLTYGFRFFETHKLYPAGEKITEARIWQGQDKVIPAGVNQDLYITIPTGQYKNVVIEKQFPKTITAPITKGQELGKLIIKLNDKIISTQSITALQDDPQGSIWTRMRDSVGASIHRILGSEDNT